MAWFRGDDRSHNNRKLLEVGLIGTGLHWRAVSWVASEETNGVVPEVVIPSLSPELSTKARKALVEQMVHVGLWKRMDPGYYEINDYLEYNPSHEDLEAKRQAERDRLAAKRAKC